MEDFTVDNEKVEQLKKSGFIQNIIKMVAPFFAKSEEEEIPQKKYYADTLVFNEFGELLLLQRSSADDFEPSKWGLPGGKVDPGETSQQAAPRELQEETGIVGMPQYVSEWSNDQVHIYYYMTQIPKEQPIMLDTNEHYKYDWVALDELDQYDLITGLGERLEELVGYEEDNELTDNPFEFTIVEPLDIHPLEDPIIGEPVMLKSVYQEINEAFQVIAKGFDEGEVDEASFLKAKSQRDYLMSYHSIKEALDAGEAVDDLFLKAITEDFISDEYLLKAETKVPLTASLVPGSDKIKGGKHIGTGKSVEELEEYARKSPLEKLHQFIKQSDDAELRKIAHQEIARREKEEKPQDDEPEPKAKADKPKPKVRTAKPKKKPERETNPVLTAPDNGNANVEDPDKKQGKSGDDKGSDKRKNGGIDEEELEKEIDKVDSNVDDDGKPKKPVSKKD